MTIASGPTALVGAAVTVAPYRFSGPAFAPVVDAPLVISERSDWTIERAAPCAPKYVGPAGALERAIMVQAGWRPDLDNALTGKLQVPGAEARSFADGDSRAGLLLAADARNPALAPIVEALRDGEAPRATLLPQRSEYDELFDDVGWTVWRALLIVQAFAALELAACRLCAFMRWQGAGTEQCGLPCCHGARRARNMAWPAAAQPLCLLYAMLNAYRLAYFVVDPYHSRGIFSLALNCLLASCDDSMAASGDSLFIVYLAARARASARSVAEEAGASVAEAEAHFLARVPLARATLFVPVAALAFLNLLFDFTASLTFFWVLDPNWLAAWYWVVSVAVPGSLIVLGLATAGCVSAALGDSASAETRRLLSRICLWAPCRAVALLAQVALVEWGMCAPSRMAAVSFVHSSALIMASYLQSDALLPEEGVPVPIGPLRWAAEAVHALAARCWSDARRVSVGPIIPAGPPAAVDISVTLPASGEKMLPPARPAARA
ncbi:hypothetical protein T492DRAFT_843827 [Pavlovales sp. CCMP2436]|nr:hypothetical protein T492DRAFT_843827 [Pavlovales sp. CCMP2436]